MKKKILCIGCIIFLLFGLYNIMWSAIVYHRYNDFIVGMDEIYPHRTYATVGTDGYTYNVKLPDYLSFVGNLGIQKSEHGNCALIIWPGVYSATDYGVIIQAADGQKYAIGFTSERVPVSDTPEEVKQVAFEYSDQINELFDKANEMWTIE